MATLIASTLPANSHPHHPPTRQNRRQGRRHRLNVPATLTPEGGGPPIHAHIVELSVGGIGVSSPTAVPLHQVYVVSAYDTLLPPGLRVRVVSQRAHGVGHFFGAAIL